MKLDTITLYFREGSSDKVYQADLVKEPGGRFLVNFAYGRRGSTMNTGTKTAQPVGLDEARTIYDRLVREKTAKGYTPGADGTPYGGKDEGGRMKDEGVPRLLPQLLNPIEERAVPGFLKSALWWMQEKHDGQRVMIVCDESCIYGHNKRGQPRPLPQTVERAAERLGVPCILDGELVGDLFHAFDLLACAGEDLRAMPYSERLRRLHNRCLPLQRVGISVTPTAKTGNEKRECFDQAKEENREGVVFKCASAAYAPGRPASEGPQRKFKFVASASCIVTGRGSKRSVGLGLWPLETPANLVPVGNVTIPPNQAVPEPGAVVEVRYLYAYRGGSLYQPVYLGERDDVEPAECSLGQLKFKAD